MPVRGRGSGSSGGGGDEPLGYGGAAAGGPGGSGGGGRGQAWATGGLNFDTSGLKEFTKALEKAAEQVERFWKPFTDVNKANQQTKDFFDKLRKEIKATSKQADDAGLKGLIAGGEGERSGGLGGDSTVSAAPGGRPSFERRPLTVSGLMHGRGGAAREAFGQRWEQERVHGGQPFFRSAAHAVGAGAMGGARGGEPIGLASGAAAVLAGAQRYTEATADDAMAIQTTALNIAMSQGQRGDRSLKKYRDELAESLGQRGWGFQGPQDRAMAGLMAQRMGINVMSSGGGLSPVMESAGVMGVLTGTSGAAQMQVQQTMRGAGFINTARMLGVQAQPGGKPQAATQTYQQLRDRIFAPLGRPPTKEEVRLTLRTPGTPSYVLLGQIFQGDTMAQESFTKWVESSAPESKKTAAEGFAAQRGRDITDIETLKESGATTSTAEELRATQEEIGKRQSKTYRGMLEGIETAADAQEQLNRALGAFLGFVQPVTDFFSNLTGIIGQLPSGPLGSDQSGGFGGGGLLGAVGSYAVGRSVFGMLGKGLGGLGGGGGGGGMGGMAGRLGGLAGRLPGGLAATAGRALGGGAVAYGGNKLGQWVSGLGRRDGDANDWAKAAGTVGKWGTFGAGVGTMIAPGLGTAIGGGIGTGIGAVHAGGRALIENADKIGGWLNPFGDPVPDSGRMPTLDWYRSGQSDIGDAPEPSAAQELGSLRGPGKVQGMNADFVARLARMFTDNPKLSLTSGFRSRADQERLYREKPGLAAPPGKSKHEKGLAADIGPRSEYGWIAQNLDKYGLSLPMPSKEPWHVQPAGGVSGGAIEAASQPQPEDAGTGAGAVTGAIGGGVAGPKMIQDYNFLSGGGYKGTTAGGRRAMAASTEGGGVVANATPGAKLNVEEALRLARAAGFRGSALQTMVAIAMGESGLDSGAKGDTTIQTREWGPSVGLWQVRTLKGETDKGTNRDINKLLSDVGFQAKAAWDISGGGQNYQPWSVYTSGKYRQYMPQVQKTMQEKGIGDPVGDQAPVVMVGAQSSGQPGGGLNVTIQNATFKAEIARGSPEEAERFARFIMEILGDRHRLQQIARGTEVAFSGV